MSGIGLSLVIGLLVVVAAVLTSAEAAISTFSRARAAELARERRTGSAALLRILDDPARVLNTALFLRLLAETSAIVLASAMVFRLSGSDAWVSVIAAIAIMAVVSFVFIGVGPRTLGRQRAEGVALWLASPLLLLSRVLGPIPALLIVVGNAITPGKGFKEGPFSSEAELRELVDLAEASSLIETDERRMLHQVFELGDTIVREVMVPRTDVISIERHKTLRQAMSLMLRSGYSRVPVVGEDLDDVIGVVFLKDVAQRIFEHREAESTQHVEKVMRGAVYVPDTKPCDDLLREMQAARTHLAMVVDEYGGTAGLVTIEDVLEEIVGEITDEFDRESLEVLDLGDGSFRVPARYPVDDLDEIVGVAIVDDEVDSVVGLIAKHLGKVPIPGSQVEVDGVVLRAESAGGRRNRIATVLVSRIPDPDTEGVVADVSQEDPTRA